MKVEAIGYIEDGKAHVLHGAKFWDTVKTLAKKKKRTYIKITAERQYKQRTNPENRYYWGVIISITADYIEENYLFDYENEETGETIHPDIDQTCEMLHELMKKKFLCVKVVSQETGEEEYTALSTSKLPTVKFEQYAEKCRRWINDFFGLNIPLPNEQAEINF